MIKIEVSLGELIDRITILEIKLAYLKDEIKLQYVRDELNSLRLVLDTIPVEVPTILYQKLYAVNLTLWNIEDAIRKKESELSFDDEFIELARSVYVNNDLRYAVKRQISLLYSGDVMEQKSYA